MAIYKIFPQKDSTIYEHLYRTTQNTGYDEILELNKVLINNTGSNSRILIKFFDSDIDSVFSLIGSSTWSASLDLFSTEHENLVPDQDIIVAALSGSWVNGTGKFLNVPITTNGVSWLYRDDIETSWLTSSFSVGSTGSWGRTSGGGNWYTASIASQSFSYNKVLDLSVDVTSIVDLWNSSSLVNDGFILKRTDSDEQSTNNLGNLQFYSTDTHTIYSPSLTFKWDDSVYLTGSLTVVADSDIVVKPENLRREYKVGEIPKVKFFVRDRFPTRVFQTSSLYSNGKAFTSSSYYSIRDAKTEDIIIPFDDNYTKISVSGGENYFKLYLNGLQPERYYRMVIKTLVDGETLIFDDNYYFKLVR